MAYSTTNPPALISQRVGGGGAVWSYSSADAVGDVDAAGYFTNGDALGMQVGDEVRVFDTETPLATTCWVSAVTAGGAATVTADA
jgi:hypothetical protein